MNNLLGIVENDSTYKFEAKKDFFFVNNLFKDFYRNDNKLTPIIVEDLWYWGYFNQEIENAVIDGKEIKRRFTKFNSDKYYADRFNIPENIAEMKELSKTFRDLMAS